MCSVPVEMLPERAVHVMRAVDVDYKHLSMLLVITLSLPTLPGSL